MKGLKNHEIRAISRNLEIDFKSIFYNLSEFYLVQITMEIIMDHYDGEYYGMS